MWQTVRRITNEILGVGGFVGYTLYTLTLLAFLYSSPCQMIKKLLKLAIVSIILMNLRFDSAVMPVGRNKTAVILKV